MKFVKLVKSASGYISKKQLQDAIDNNDENILSMFKAEWIGQGYGYKSEKNWNEMQLDEVIYIPEYGYREGTDIPEDLYTKQDFLNIVGGNEGRAQNLFSDVDWQSPETLANEWDWMTDYNETANTPHEGVEPQYDEEGHYISKK